MQTAEWRVSDLTVISHLCASSPFVPDIFSSRDDISRNREEFLAAITPDAREDYGEAYISSLTSNLTRLSRHMAPDLTPVTDAILDALLSVRPKSVYSPGQMAWLIPALQRCLPVAMFDAITMKFLTQKSVCKPARLGRSWGSWEIRIILTICVFFCWKALPCFLEGPQGIIKKTGKHVWLDWFQMVISCRQEEEIDLADADFKF